MVKINAIAIKPPEGFEGMALAPDQLAAILARYSRSSKGVDYLYDKFKDTSPEGIMAFSDYGHASILDLTGQMVVTIDRCSMFFAMELFNLAKLGSGQESSTRYINFSKAKFILSDIPDYLENEFIDLINECVKMYQEELQYFKDTCDKARFDQISSAKKRIRAINNYAMDKARSWLPMCLETSMTIMMNAREWARVIKELSSYDFDEFGITAIKILDEVQRISPLGVRHTTPTKASIYHKAGRFEDETFFRDYLEGKVKFSQDMSVHVSHLDVTPALEGDCPRENKYDTFSDEIRMMPIRYKFNFVPMAIIRDMNRARTGSSLISTKPVGFKYNGPSSDKKEYLILKVNSMLSALMDSKKHPYGLLFGHLGGFCQTTTLDKVIYTIELRTAPGAHEVYCELYTMLAKEIKKYMPSININVGKGEIENL